jgi:arylsulfatase A
MNSFRLVFFILGWVAGKWLWPSNAVALTALPELPNFVFILADDLGYGDLHCYGSDDLRTPHLDQLAQDGIRFTDFYANGPVCSPTRAAFMTGRYQQRLGLEDAVTYQEFGHGLPEEGTTLADDLHAAGYATGLFGKWHLGYDLQRRPKQQGFDHFFGLLGGNHHYFQHFDRVGVADLWLENQAIDREGYTTDLITTEALAFIERYRGQPFFLYLSHPAPHFPWQGPQDADKVVEPKKPSWQQGDRATYVAMVEHLDASIGRIIAQLGRLGLRERTLIVFSSDNGGHTHSRNLPLRDFKGSLWEGGIRVPCLASWPGVLPKAAVETQAAITMDWTATFRRLAQRPAATAGEDGIDLMPRLLDPQRPPEARELYWRRRNVRGKQDLMEGRAVRAGSWKLLEESGGQTYLFDLARDISERENVASQHPTIVERLHQLLEDWEHEVGRVPW